MTVLWIQDGRVNEVIEGYDLVTVQAMRLPYTGFVEAPVGWNKYWGYSDGQFIPPSAELTQKLLTDAVQSHLDNAAKTKGYDGILSACSYAATDNAFQTEGIAYAVWRSAVWASYYAIMADVQAGQRGVPTVSELIAELPVLVLG